MRNTLLTILLAALLAGPLTAAPARCGSLTMDNQTKQQHYCAVFDLWTVTGPEKRQLPCKPADNALFDAATLEAIGKIAVYKIPPNSACNLLPKIPQARHDPGSMLLPSRNFLITIHPNGTVKITEHD